MKLGQSQIRHVSKKELSIVLRKQNMRQWQYLPLPRIMCCPNTCVFDNALKRCTGAMCPDYSGASPEPVSNAVDEDDPGKDAELI